MLLAAEPRFEWLLLLLLLLLRCPQTGL